MTDETTEGTAAKPVLRTLADKMNRLIDQTHPAGRGPAPMPWWPPVSTTTAGAVPPASERIVSINLVKAVAVTPRLVGYHYGG